MKIFQQISTKWEFAYDNLGTEYNWNCGNTKTTNGWSFWVSVVPNRIIYESDYKLYNGRGMCLIYHSLS